MSELTRPPLRLANRENRIVDVAQLFDKSPPTALNAEKALLGSLIIDWRVTGEVIQIISSAQDFSHPGHAAIYETIVSLYNQSGGCDLVGLAQALEDRKVLAQVGGNEYLIELYETVPSAASAPHHAAIVREKAIVRQLIESAGLTLDDCYNQNLQSRDLLDRAGKRLFDLQNRQGGNGASSIGELIQVQMAAIEAREGTGLTGLPTGLDELDEITNGLHKGELIIIGARPSMGKTALMLSIAEHMAHNQIPVGVFSMEMGKEQLASRMLSGASGVDSHKIRKNYLVREDYQALMAASGRIKTAQMHIDDTPSLSLTQIRARARRMVSEHGIQAMFVDYLQLMHEPDGANRQEQVAALSRGLKGLARELNIPLVCLAQLNRQVEGRGDSKRPRMSDLKESGGIEQDADVVALLHREAYYHKGDHEWLAAHPNLEDAAELIIDKQRNGPTGVIELRFDAATMAFKNARGGQ